uniref:Uncharacterized protein n=1 Tax=Acrobeloides nanus TaxID=290746 RepID=A0A914CYU3_9BILA
MHSLVRQNLQDFLFSYKEPLLSIEQVNIAPALIDSQLSHQIRKSVNEKNATQQLTSAKLKPVSFAVRCNTSFNGMLEHDIPVPGRAISFEKGQFLHVYEVI